MEIWLIVVNATLVIVTILYVIFTYSISESHERSVQVMKEQSETYYRPYVTISHNLTPPSMIELIIANKGKTAAKDLKLSIDKDFYQLGTSNDNYKISNLPAFKNKIETFPPDSKITLELMSGSELEKKTIDDPATPLVFTITATYSFNNKYVTENTIIDLRQYIKTFIYKSSLEREIENLTKEFKELNKFIKKQYSQSN